MFTSQNSSRRSSDAFWNTHDSPSAIMRTHAESRRASGDGDRGVLERVSQVLSSWRQDPFVQVIDEVDESLYSSQTSLSSPSRGLDRDTPIASPTPGSLGDGGGDGRGRGIAWLAREKLRRTVKARQALERDAELGRCGILTDSFGDMVPRLLNQAHMLGCPSVSYFKLPLLGHYSALTALTQTVVALHAVFSDFTVSAFDKKWGGHRHVVPEKDWTKVQRAVGDVTESNYIVLGRNIGQWEESVGGGSGLVGMDTKVELNTTQLFSSLGGRFMFPATSSSLAPRTPLKGAGDLKDTFVPRRRLAFVLITHCQVSGDWPHLLLICQVCLCFVYFSWRRGYTM